ncbi:hypothetical protein Bca4012_063502 [Brassica carinata]
MCFPYQVQPSPTKACLYQALSYTSSIDKISPWVAPTSLPLIFHETTSTLHPHSRLFMPLRVESGLLHSLMTICVCPQDTEEA